jgi:hypothetical protein
MKNLYKILAWIFTIIGAVMMFLSILAFLLGGKIFHAHWGTYYAVVYNFLMFAIVFLLFHLTRCKEKKE